MFGLGASAQKFEARSQSTAGSERLEVEMLKKRTLFWREARLEVTVLKAPHVRTTFAGSNVEKICNDRQIDS